MSNESKMCDCNQGRLPCTCKEAQQSTGYTAVDMTTAAAQGFRDGAASVVVELPSIQCIRLNGYNSTEVFEVCKKAIIAAGWRIKE